MRDRSGTASQTSFGMFHVLTHHFVNTASSPPIRIIFIVMSQEEPFAEPRNGSQPTTPGIRVQVDPPDAPPPNPAARDLPTATPASSATPSARPPVDLAEFDPYATPAPRASSSRQEAQLAGAESAEPSFNFSGFLRDLRTKSAEPVARFLKR